MQFLRKLTLWLCAVAIFSGCDNNDQPEPVLTITAFTPASAPVGTDVTITGTKFSTVPANNVVKFGSVQAEVKSSTATQIVAVVPFGATNGPISVSVGTESVMSTASFTLGARPVTNVSGQISANTTWSNKNVYFLTGFVYVTSGTTLTIEKGTIIKGDFTTKGSLIVEQGAKIIAEGTADAPIVFTSNRPRGQRNYGDWGGIVLIGKARHNQAGSITPEGGIRGTLGTFNEPNDNSGILKFVRIEFAGVALTPQANSEINGLSLYGVGSGTTIENVQVSYSGDDSYEWFGGTVNAKRLIAFRGWDDDWDTDWGFSGKVQYAVSLRDPNFADQSGSNGFESDNFNPGEPATGANAGLPLTEPIFANVSNFVFPGMPSAVQAQGNGAYQSAMHIRRNTAISIFNTLMVGYPEGLRLDGVANGRTFQNVTNEKLQLRGVVLANTTTPVRGANLIPNADAVTFFSTAAFVNQTVGADYTSLGLNAMSFNLTTPVFTPNTGSPLLTGAVWTGKGADAFFTKETFRGAFGTTNWTTGWANFDPQNTDYDK